MGMRINKHSTEIFMGIVRLQSSKTSEEVLFGRLSGPANSPLKNALIFLQGLHSPKADSNDRLFF